ncbi:MAG: histidinol-phosphatase HisJ family protein [Clostridia bacterium]|nr:histidinol-phosphatase HisJ family protein [Clostridia bacterium]
MLIDSSIHNHTTFCDGKSTPEEMIESAYRAGFKDFGVLCHATMTSGNYDWPVRDEKGFIDCVKKLKEKYAGKINVWCGIERDFFGKDGEGFDYKIDGVHQILYNGVYCEVDHSKECFERGVYEVFSGNIKKYIKTYYETVCEMIERNKTEYIAHVDLVTKFNDGFIFFDEKESWYQNYVKECITFAIEKDCLLEMNFGAMTRGVKNTPYPASYLLDFIQEKKGKIIVGGDCHNAQFTAFGMREGEILLREHGFKSVTLYKNGKYTEIGL